MTKELLPGTSRGVRRYNAFTLIELIVVVSIIAVLGALVLSTVGYARKKGARARAETEIAAISAACENYKADNGVYPSNSDTQTLDPTNEFDVLWAMATRCDPEQAVEIIRRSASGSLDVCIPPENKGHSSRCLIDACMPYERRHQFPPITESSEELKNEIRAKWRETIYE